MYQPLRARDVEAPVNAWLPFTFAMNSVDRAIRLPDLYPLILPPAVIGKLSFVHSLVRGVATASKP
jgi:hypothetical protein